MPIYLVGGVLENRILRTIGASVILAGITVAGLTQVSSGRDLPPPDIGAETTSTTVSVADTETSFETTTLAPDPFVYRVGLLSGISTTNFWAYFGREASVWNTYVLGPTKAALFEVEQSSGRLIPDLSLHAPPDPQQRGGTWSVDVTLDPDRMWSDGVPVTANDLVFTFDVVRTLELGGSWAAAFPRSVTSIRAVDEHRVRIEFDGPPDLRTWPHGPGLAPLMAEHVWEPAVAGVDADSLYALDGAGDVSSGPLHLETASASQIVSMANPGHPGPTPDVVEYHVFPDEAGLVDALAAGRVDTLLTPKGLTAAQADGLSAVEGVGLSTSPAHGVRYLGFNLTREPMDDPAFRVAVGLLSGNRGLDGTSAPRSFIAETNQVWHDPQRSAALDVLYSGSPQDRLARAVEGLEQAGYEWESKPRFEADVVVPGTGLTVAGRPPQPLTILTPGDAYDPDRPDHVAAIAEVLGSLGFDARPVETDFDTVVDLVFTAGEEGEFEYDMYVLGWTLGNPALPDFYRPLFAPDGSANNTGYRSDDFVAALTAYERATSIDQARAAVWDMEATLARDLPYLLLYRAELIEAFRSDRVVYEGVPGPGGLQGQLGAVDKVRPAG